jgi:hypothetical protein
MDPADELMDFGDFVSLHRLKERKLSDIREQIYFGEDVGTEKMDARLDDIVLPATVRIDEVVSGFRGRYFPNMDHKDITMGIQLKLHPYQCSFVLNSAYDKGDFLLSLGAGSLDDLVGRKATAYLTKGYTCIGVSRYIGDEKR